MNANAIVRPLKLAPKLLHEGTHLAAAAPWLQDWNIVIGPTGSESELDVYVEFVEDAPAWGIALSYLAPMLTALLGLLTVGGVVLVHGLPLTASGTDLLLWTAAAIGWTLYGLPSRRDIDGALREVRDA